MTVLNFKTAETILSKLFPLDSTTQLIKLEAQNVVRGLNTNTCSDYSFDAPIEHDVVLRLTDERAYSKLEASSEAPPLPAAGQLGEGKRGEGGKLGTVSLACVIPHDDTTLTGALDIVKVVIRFCDAPPTL